MGRFVLSKARIYEATFHQKRLLTQKWARKYCASRQCLVLCGAFATLILLSLLWFFILLSAIFLSFTFFPLPTFSCRIILLLTMLQSPTRLPKAKVSSQRICLESTFFPLYILPVCQKCFPHPPSYSSFLAGEGLLDSWEHWDINNNAEFILSDIWVLIIDPLLPLSHFTFLIHPSYLFFSSFFLPVVFALPFLLTLVTQYLPEQFLLTFAHHMLLALVFLQPHPCQSARQLIASPAYLPLTFMASRCLSALKKCMPD